MKKNLLKTLFAGAFLSMLFPLTASADVEINATNFPDENFRNWLLEQDFGQDEVITDEEIDGITIITISNKNISSLKGIEYFTALTQLWSSDNQLTSLDVSKNTALTLLFCYSNQLTSLDVSGCTALTELWCYQNQLASLDVSQNTALTLLSCSYNQLTSLDVSKNTALTSLSCGDNQLASLDVSNNTVLTGLSCFANRLTSLDVSKNTALTSLECSDNPLDLLDVSQNTALTSLSCSDNQLTSLDVSKNTALTYLGCTQNQLTSLDVSHNTALTTLYCGVCQLTSLDVSKNTALTVLNCLSNQLTSLDVSQNTVLTSLSCGYNSLISLDVSKNKVLTSLLCNENQLTSLDVSKNTALTSLSCEGNQLTSLDVSNNVALTRLSCGDNQLTSLDVSKNTALTELRCEENQIRGIMMDAFIERLPKNTSTTEYKLYIYNRRNNETNICTHSQVVAIKDKGWIPMYYYNIGWIEYEGCDDETIVETVSVGEDGLATYCPAFNIDFSKAEKIAAYKASVDGNTVNLTKVTTVAAGEGVLLRSINGGAATEELPTAVDAEEDADNVFVGTLTATTLSEKDGNITNFVLSKVNNVVGFYKANDTQIAAWKAYLPVKDYNPAADARGLTLVFDDGNTTTISEIDNATTADNAIYTLGGARVKSPVKGLYIKNGKKIVIK